MIQRAIARAFLAIRETRNAKLEAAAPGGGGSRYTRVELALKSAEQLLKHIPDNVTKQDGHTHHNNGKIKRKNSCSRRPGPNTPTMVTRFGFPGVTEREE